MTSATEAGSGVGARPVVSGARSGVVLGVASGASIVAAYVFLLAAGRILGSEDYGSLAALLGLLAVVLIPAGALQMAVSREISRRVASADAAGAARLAHGTLRMSLLATVPLLAVALALAAPLAHVLHIHSVAFVALADTTLATALVFPVATGVLQGQQRFHALAVLYVFPWLVRLVVLAVLASAGARLGGAIAATAIGAIAGTALALFLIREPIGGGTRLPRDELLVFLRYLGPVAAGLVGIALLTHADILIVKARFSGDEAGAYAAASAFARVGFFLPATILAVLFPRTAARQARGEETHDILGRSLLATAVFCGALVLFYAAAGVGLVSTTFGPDFAEGGAVLGPFALAIGLFSIANVLVGYHLSRGEIRYAWIVAAGVVVQVAALAVLPSSLRGVVWTNVAIGAALLVAHELLVGSSVPALRAGLRHGRGALVATRKLLPEASYVLLGSTAFVCALFWPLVSHLSSTIIGSRGSDATASVAWFWTARHESGFHLLGLTHHTLTGAPFGWDQTNALNIQVFLPYYPTYLVAHVVGDVAAFNLVTLAGYVLSGASMYLLMRYLGAGKLIAGWAAFVFILFPWHIARAEHASLLHLEVFVLLLLALVAAARRPSWLSLGFVSAAIFACWLTSGYFGAMAVVTTVAFAFGAALTSERGNRARVLLGGVLAGVVPSALLALAAAVSGTGPGAGLKRAAGDLTYYGLRPVELVVPPQGSLFFGDALESFWSRHSHGSNPTEISGYLGLLTLALALAWLVTALRRPGSLSQRQRVATSGLVAVFVVGFLFALPSPINLFGHDIWAPSRVLYAVLPAVRVPSRWAPLLMTALVPLAALGLQWVTHHVARYGRHLSLGVIGAAVVLSFVELAIHPAERRFRTVPLPPEYAADERTPPGILDEYPLGYSDVYRLGQRRHGRPLLNGAPPETPADSARLMLLDPTEPGTAEDLSLLEVSTIAIHPGAHVDAEVPPNVPEGSAAYKLVGRFANGSSVWQVLAKPAPAFVTLPGGFASPKRTTEGFIGYALVSSAGVGVIELSARSASVVRLVFAAFDPNGKQRTLRLSDGQCEESFSVVGKTRVSVLVAVPRGRAQLLLKMDPAPTSEEDTVVISAPRAEKAGGQAQLQPATLSADPGF
jgi:O-antigen/teichoic acid export membrane protein